MEDALPFNKLTEAEVERLALLMEEMAEASQVIGKILRHGYDSSHADYGHVLNRHLLQKEVGHVLAAVNLLSAPTGLEPQVLADLSLEAVESARVDKHQKMQVYLHHQPVYRRGMK